MKEWKPTLQMPWTMADAEAAVDDALRVLEKVGVESRHALLNKRLCELYGCELQERRILFKPQRVRQHIEARRKQISEARGTERSLPGADLMASDDHRFSLGGCWACMNYCDPETQAVRPATSAECAQMCRLWDSRDISGAVPVVPGDVPPELQTLTAERIALENSRKLGGLLTVQDPEEVRFLIDMNLAAGRRYLMAQQVGISPLRFDADGVETALMFRDNPDVDVQLAGFIPMAGATCPLDPRAAIVQSTAEELAYDMACAALGFRREGFALRTDPFDFQYALIVFGSPEWCLYRLIVNQVCAYLNGRPVRQGSFRSTAKRPDEQAACERTASVLWQALMGVRSFGAVGQLSVDEVFSPQQAVLDREILAYVERLMAGLEIDDSLDPVALIAEGVREGTFSGLEDTVRRFRRFCMFPDIFRHWNVERWRAEGEPSVLGVAWRQAQEEIARSTHRLTDLQQREVERIYRRAVEYVRRRVG